MTDTFIFDLDGTLVNSIFDLADSVNAVLRAHGFPEHGYEAYKYFVGNGTLKLIERAVPEGHKDAESVAALHQEFAGVYEKHLTDKTVAYEGIPELLGVLKSRGAKLAVASNKPDKFSCEIVEKLFPGVFDYVAGKREGVHRKPDPEIMIGIMSALGSVPESCVHTGDSAVDIKTAHNAGICAVGCTWGFRKEDELITAGADHIIHDPGELPELF